MVHRGGSLATGEIFSRRFQLAQGEQLNLYVEGYWGFDGILELFDPNTTLIDRVDDVGVGQSYDINPRLTYVANRTGEYLLLVYGYDNSGGDFRLYWSIE